MRGLIMATCVQKNTALIIIDMQTDFCGRRRLCRQDGIRPVADARAADRTDQAAARGDAGARLPHHPYPRGATAPTSRIFPPTSAGARGRSAPGSAIPAPWRPGAGARRGPAGRSSPTSRRCQASPSSTSPGKGSFCATDLELMLRLRGIENIVLTGHHDRRLRPHHDARSQRPRLRMRP